MTNRYRIEIARRWADVDRRWCEATDSLRASPFQHPDWLRTWYAAFGSSAGITPLLVAVTDAVSGDLAVLMPLIERRSGPLVFLEFADLDVTDCNAPALGPAAPTIAEAAVQLWREVSAALPACDVVRFAKMPAVIGNRPNPLAALPGAQPSELRTWSLHAGGSWEDYLKSLDRPYRKELGRSLRLFEGAGAGRFLVAKSDVDASRILTVIDELQRDRLEERQAKHIFDQPAHHRFYNEFAAAGMNSGSCALTALELDGEIVAGITGDCRQASAHPASNCQSRWIARASRARAPVDRAHALRHARGRLYPLRFLDRGRPTQEALRRRALSPARSPGVRILAGPRLCPRAAGEEPDPPDARSTETDPRPQPRQRAGRVIAHSAISSA